MTARITMKHIAKRRARARRPFPICITPFRKGVANRRNTTASLRQLYHTAHKKVKPSRPGGLASYSARDTQAAVGAAVRVERRLVRRTGPRSSELLQDAAGLSVRHVHQLQHALVGRAVIRPIRHKGYLRLSLFHVLTSSPFVPPDRRGAHIRATETKKFKNR